MVTQLIVVLAILSASATLVMLRLRRLRFERHLQEWRQNWTMEAYLAQRAASRDQAVSEDDADPAGKDGFLFIEGPLILSRLAIAE